MTPRPDSEPVSLSVALDEVVRGLGPGNSAAALGGVFGRWEEAVGEAVAAHAQPRSLESGRLLVEVDQPGWATQLRYLEHDLVHRLNAVAGPGIM